MMLARALSLAAALAATVAGSAARADTYPSRPITITVPYAAGGPSDAIARLLASSMTKTLGQQVLVESVVGAGGTIAAARVARAAPDGYTLLIHHVALAASPALYKSLPYDTLSAFEPIGLVNYGPFLLVTRSDFPAKDVGELLTVLRRDGAKIDMAHAGTGSGSHMCGIMLMQALGTEITYVPYKGTGPALTDLVGGQVDMLCDQTTNALPQIRAGKVKPFAVTALKRIEQLPDLPTLDESGLKGFEMTVWHALYAPKGTPKPIIETLNKALQTALADPNVLARFGDLGTLLFPADQRSPEALNEKLSSELKHWSEVAAAAKIVKE